jgi:hypothetical protein
MVAQAITGPLPVHPYFRLIRVAAIAVADGQPFHPLIQRGKREQESLNSLRLIPRGPLRQVDMDQGRRLTGTLPEKCAHKNKGWNSAQARGTGHMFK